MVPLYEGPENTRAPGQKLHRGLGNSTAMSRVPLVKMESLMGAVTKRRPLADPSRQSCPPLLVPASAVPALLPLAPLLQGTPCLPRGVVWLG